MYDEQNEQMIKQLINNEIKIKITEISPEDKNKIKINHKRDKVILKNNLSKEEEYILLEQYCYSNVIKKI